MIWLVISILCFIWTILWIIVNIELFKQAMIHKYNVKGAPLWTLLVPMVICAVTLVLFIKTLT
jgi:TRAP-type C4-dicarboxylate transport system permease small subunit